MIEKLIVIDYQEGAGGEFIANWLSAHFGQELHFNMQTNPNYLQKWFNSHSLIYQDWRDNFIKYLEKFFEECVQYNIQHIAVSYHLYKYPEHVDILKQYSPARFVRINCNEFHTQITNDYQRKVLDRILGSKDFLEIKFMLQNQTQERAKKCINLFKQNKLTYLELVTTGGNFELKKLPSRDIEIIYEDFFINFENTKTAYHQLCYKLELQPDQRLLNKLIQRNKKNQQEQLIT